MALQSAMLSGYSKKDIQNCAHLTQVISPVKQCNLKMKERLDSSLTKMPKIPTMVFPPGELPRPAVIGLGGPNGSYKDSTTTIKQILASVLNLPSNVKSALSMDFEDDYLEYSEDSSNDLDCDLTCVPTTSCSQNYVQLAKHKASWDKSQLDSPITSEEEPANYFPKVSVTRRQSSAKELEFPGLLKCEQCVQMILNGSDTIEYQGPLNLQKEKRRFSSPNLSNPNQRNPQSEKCTVPLKPSTADAETCTVKDTSGCPRRSLSYASILKAEESMSTEPLHSTGENLFEPTVSLEKENEHFLAADLIISLVERRRSNWLYEQWRKEGVASLMKQDQEEPCLVRKKANSESAVSVDSGYGGGLPVVQTSPTETILEENEESKNAIACDDLNIDEYVIIDMEDCEVSKPKQSNDKPKRQPDWGLNSAEQIARNLYRNFRELWTQVATSEANLPTWNRADSLAGTNTTAEELESSVSLVEELKKCKRREKEDWAPPTFEIISIVQPNIKRDVLVALQNYLCSGCGSKVEQGYTNRLRYCDYMGKYFCDCCHSYAESAIPARIFSKWNFSKYYVSNFAKKVLEKIWDSHQFDVLCENPELYSKVKDLNRVKEVQEQLIQIKKLVATCRFSKGMINAFEAVSSHLTERLDRFTLADLFNIKQRTLLPTLRELLATVIAHVDTCVLCQAKGFICEFCQNNEVIFPFQTASCRRCEVCKSCYHKWCFKTGNCPKCARIKAREALQTDSPFTSSGESNSPA